MRRIAVCLLITLASATVAARESKLADANGGSCPSRTNSAAARPAERDPAAVAIPVKKTRPSLPTASGGGEETRLPSPRWHRFLPGMFR